MIKKAELWEAIDTAWRIIANASNGDWSKETPDWAKAASDWRNRWINGKTEKADGLGTND